MGPINREKPIPPPEGAKERIARTAPTFALVFCTLVAFSVALLGDFDRKTESLLMLAYNLAFWIWFFQLYRPSMRLQRALRDQGYGKVSLAKSERLWRFFGRDAIHRLPSRDEAIMIPGVEADSGWLTARNALTLGLWNRDPRHYDIIAKGYRDLTWAQLDAILATYGENAEWLVPRRWPWINSEVKRAGGDFPFLATRLRWATGREIPPTLEVAEANR